VDQGKERDITQETIKNLERSIQESESIEL